MSVLEEEKCNHRGTEAQRYYLSERVIGAAMSVHRELGPGLLEGVYELAVVHELGLIGLRVARQVEVPVIDKGVDLGAKYRIDLLVEGELLLELKSVSALEPVHTAQMLTYLRLLSLRTGLLINFNVSQLRSGIKRIAL
ncbi:GxxExxY protein [Roseateles asaccharophilus]|uniref:GxxExxY protein n=1 Tax=Roseateles asaccharophilus TaxID=582607 RepID=A0ABU2A7D9_9BURK|nr:GxxExxY protein [Roseateles asaccharophilus]MDR7333084.1 GxxExxY protein [Roseateles asaccharophilus]